MFFSGEAMYGGKDMGTVEAALASGLETARTLLAVNNSGSRRFQHRHGGFVPEMSRLSTAFCHVTCIKRLDHPLRYSCGHGRQGSSLPHQIDRRQP